MHQLGLTQLPSLQSCDPSLKHARCLLLSPMTFLFFERTAQDSACFIDIEEEK
jgi:hypothetical protein